MVALASYLAKKTGKANIIKTYQNLCNKKKELEAQLAYKSLPNTNVIVRWLALQKLQERFYSTQYAQGVVKTEQKEVEKQLLLLARKQIDDASESMAAKNYRKVILDSFDWLVHLTTPGYTTEFCNERDQLVVLAKKAVEEQMKSSSVVATVPASQEIPEEKLKQLRDQFNKFLSNYRDYQRKWQFAQAMREIDPIAEKAEKLKEIYPTDPDLLKITDIHKEVKLLMKAWDYAIEGAASLTGRSRTLFLKNGAIKAGKIEKYQEGKIYLSFKNAETKKKQVDAISLSDLKLTSLASFITHNNKKNPEVYVALACLYYINNADLLCNSASDRAVKLGISSTEVSKFQEWAKKVLEERNTRLAISAQKRTDIQTAFEQHREELRLNRLRKKAKNLIAKILKEYLRHNDKMVLEYLHTLKIEVGDKPGGRDELVKLNYILKNEEGQSLSKIASTSFVYCPYCRNTGEIKCPKCKGEGKIKGKVRWLSGKDGIKIEKPDEYCDRCKGTGVIDCPYCYEKKHNRIYIMVKDYFCNF